MRVVGDGGVSGESDETVFVSCLVLKDVFV